MRYCRLLIVHITLMLTVSAMAQELLQNPSFTDDVTGEPLADCAESFEDVIGWEFNQPEGDRRNGDFMGGGGSLPTCPRDGDGIRASLQGWGSTGGVVDKSLYQTVSTTPFASYRLTGLWWFGKDWDWVNGNLTVRAELVDGDSPSGSVIAYAEEVIQNADTGAWLPFTVCGQAASEQATVVIRAVATGFQGFALHVDALSLVEVDACGSANAVGSISPAYAVRGGTLNATVNGIGFLVNGVSAVRLKRAGQPDISATSIQVQSDSVLSCAFDLTGAANGRWSLAVDFSAGNPLEVVQPAVISVVLDDLSNPSFELPAAPGGCPPTPIPGHPTDWLVSYQGSWGDAGWDETTVYRDGDLLPPSCPLPEWGWGDHYASTYSEPPAPNAQPQCIAYQVLEVDPARTYTISGYFAGAGANQVYLELLDGDELVESVIDGALVHDEGPGYDWTFAFASGQPSGNLMTVRWRVISRNPGPHVAHADNLRLDICESPVTLVGLSPADADNTGPITLTVSGSGFETGSIPQLTLTQAGAVPIVSKDGGVTVISDTELTCTFDLGAARSGMYDLLLLKDGCSVRLDDAFTVVYHDLANGGFEQPDGELPHCGETQALFGLPDGWSTDLTAPGSLDRDHHVERPATCPSPSGGHYGSLTVDRAGTLMAYQTLRVTPTAGYTFSGQFAGGGPAGDIAEIVLIDGTLETGTVLASTQINDGTNGAAYDWRERSVSAYVPADSTVMTVAWRFNTTDADGTPRATHADGLALSKTAAECSSARPDADADGDVDQDDFGVFQACLTGMDANALPESPAYCRCLDMQPTGGDLDIDQLDYGVFEGCATGPAIAVDPCCDGGEGCPQ